MPFEPGISGNPEGRKPGSPNKTTKHVRDTFKEIFDMLQSDLTAQEKKANLLSWAIENPGEFYKLAAKLIPVQIGGDPENPVRTEIASSLSFDQLMAYKYGPDWKSQPDNFYSMDLDNGNNEKNI